MRIGVTGCRGRMGCLLIQQINNDQSLMFAGGTIRPSTSTEDIEGIPLFTSPQKLLEVSDVILDFTTPEATEMLLKDVLETPRPLVIGTTGLQTQQKDLIQKASLKMPLVVTPNTSIGIALLEALVEQAAKTLDPSYEIEIFEAHHRYKTDAPSGTALNLGKAAAKGRGVSFEDVSRTDSRNHSRTPTEIGFSVMRGGTLPGDHAVHFLGDGEVLTLSHRTLGRDLFAQGALEAAKWVVQQKAGLYAMRDVLEI